MELNKVAKFNDAQGNTIFHGSVREFIDTQLQKGNCRPMRFSSGRIRYGVNGFLLGREAYDYAVRKIEEEAARPAREALHRQCAGMSADEWLAGCRFYRSGGDKMCKFPDGRSVILVRTATPTNFRETSRDFLLKLKPTC